MQSPWPLVGEKSWFEKSESSFGQREVALPVLASRSPTDDPGRNAVSFCSILARKSLIEVDGGTRLREEKCFAETAFGGIASIEKLHRCLIVKNGDSCLISVTMCVGLKALLMPSLCLPSYTFQTWNFRWHLKRSAEPSAARALLRHG